MELPQGCEIGACDVSPFSAANMSSTRPAPILLEPTPVSPDLVPTAKPIVPKYDSRFENEAAAITYAQTSGQGALTVGGDGTITNRFGETMVYDSSGNLAPAPRATPVGNDTNVGPAATAAVATLDPVAAAKAAQAARAAQPGYVAPAVDPVAVAEAAAADRARATAAQVTQAAADAAAQAAAATQQYAAAFAQPAAQAQP